MAQLAMLPSPQAPLLGVHLVASALVLGPAKRKLDRLRCSLATRVRRLAVLVPFRSMRARQRTMHPPARAWVEPWPSPLARPTAAMLQPQAVTFGWLLALPLAALAAASTRLVAILRAHSPQALSRFVLVPRSALSLVLCRSNLALAKVLRRVPRRLPPALVQCPALCQCPPVAPALANLVL